MVDGTSVILAVAFFGCASLAAFLYIRFRWWQHVRSDATEVMATVRERKTAPSHDGGSEGELVLLSYEFAEQFYSPSEWFRMSRKGQQRISIYVWAETPTKPIPCQTMVEAQNARCCIGVTYTIGAVVMAIMTLVFVAKDDENSRRILAGVLLATSFVVFTVLLCSLVRVHLRTVIGRSGTNEQDERTGRTNRT
jgi:hypothetical protein